MDDGNHGRHAPAWDEARRVAALNSYEILDTAREQDFDDLAAIASQVCGTPIAVVNLVSTTRQWFKAEVGLGVRETPLETSFCGHAILAVDFMMVEDATQDPRFDCNPLVTGEPGLRFYAGALLKTPDGLPIGTMCVLDYQPRELDEHQIRTLKLLARQAMTQIELRKSVADHQAALRAQEQATEQQRLLSFELKHRMKNTLTMVQAIANQTLRAGATIEDARAAFVARLNALSRAQDILTQSSWTATPISEVVQGALAPHGGEGPRFTVSGPELQLSARCGLGLLLALHELATNAAKYGALSNAVGTVDVTWRTTSGELYFRWMERGGPPVMAPTRKGFGSTIIERLLAGYFNGTAEMEFASDGLILTLKAPLASLLLPDQEGLQ